MPLQLVLSNRARSADALSGAFGCSFTDRGVGVQLPARLSVDASGGRVTVDETVRARGEIKRS